MKSVTVLAGAAMLALAACRAETPAENMADTLEDAAEQSTPEAAELFENEAERIREENAIDPARVDRILDEAANAQLPPPQPRTEPVAPPEIGNEGR